MVPSGAQLASVKRAYIEDRLKNHYPSKVVAFYAFFITLIGLAAIALQSVLISRQTFNYQIGNGIWGGVFCFFLAAINVHMIGM